MSVTPKKLFQPAQLTSSAATYYTVPANTKTVIKKIEVCNTTANARTFTVYLVPSGGSASATNTITSATPLGPGESTFVASGQVITAGDTIQALADSASAVSIHGSGVEIV